MQAYVSTKIVQAKPANAENDGPNHKKGDAGYRIVYPDGYVSWCPKATFEQCNRLITEGEKALIFCGDQS